MNLIWSFRLIADLGDSSSIDLTSVKPFDEIRSVLNNFPAKRSILFSDLPKEDVVIWLRRHRLWHYFGSYVFETKDISSFIDIITPVLAGDVNYLIADRVEDLLFTQKQLITPIVINQDHRNDDLFAIARPVLIFRKYDSLDLLLAVSFAGY